MVLLEETKVDELIGENKPPVNIPEIGGRPRILPYCNFELKNNDILYMRVASGGGYGDPLEREPELVRRDVIDEIVSKGVAHEIYGVVLVGERAEVDIAATLELRNLLREDEVKVAK